MQPRDVGAVAQELASLDGESRDLGDQHVAQAAVADNEEFDHTRLLLQPRDRLEQHVESLDRLEAPDRPNRDLPRLEAELPSGGGHAAVRALKLFGVAPLQ